MSRMEEDNEIETIGRYLSIAHRAFLSRLGEQLSDYEISVAQLHLLFPLYKEEGIHQKDLCEIFKIDKGAVGRGLQKLEDNGFVERKDDPEDKRRNLIFLTEKSKKLKPEFISILDSIEEEAKEGLSRGEIETFTETMEKICENLGIEDMEEIMEVKND